MSVVINVSENILNRIARSTGASVLSTTDHAAISGPNILGTCALFKVEHFADDPLYVANYVRNSKPTVS